MGWLLNSCAKLQVFIKKSLLLLRALLCKRGEESHLCNLLCVFLIDLANACQFTRAEIMFKGQLSNAAS